MKKSFETFTKNIVNFRGRASRKEFWLSWLISWVFMFFSLIVFIISPILGIFLYIGILLSRYSVAVRRLHDTGKSGWLLLMNFIPVIGPLILLVHFCEKGQLRMNRYGINPLEKIVTEG